ncbi:hypothetical protein C482_10012 [Natrialba chahannaoensis JCM 10990]|uniref:Uncharacterized protein n=1 Tax=Natrialba chahannaoensis JCM 10990 TaxID=1227492 RepID=M0APE0_9EURY|nr:HTH domain-containing protein [Natrialba chahannaoensis]ELY99812.1 hypothetical protein C482_10012 [Natrialba chahannaoensis JCM 10990]
MAVSNAVGFSAIDTDQNKDLRVDCYVRSTVPASITETIKATIGRLQRLCEDGPITNYQVLQWPPAHRSATETNRENDVTRDELMTEFENWSEQHGVTLEPAFRREGVPTSPFGIGSNAPHERVRVPLVALAIYEERTNADTDGGSESLRGVVPHTERSQVGEERTYTVDSWLSEVETDMGESAAWPAQHDQTTMLEEQL